MTPDPNLAALPESYLFSEVARRVSERRAAFPGKRLIPMGIGDATLPLAPAVVRAARRACREMGCAEGFRGYGPSEGYAFLREAVARYYREELGAPVDADEVFISDGAKSSLTAILDLFAPGGAAAADPAYPVYADACAMRGRKLTRLGSPDFLPLPGPELDAQLVFLCSPGNPTGAAYGAEGLRAWVDWAAERGAVLICDAAYERYLRHSALPRSIYAIGGAKSCAIEIGSLSKSAGFTGMRCGWVVVPGALAGGEARRLWKRRQDTCSNGVSYIVQRAAEAALSPDGLRQTGAQVDCYLQNAAALAETLCSAGVRFTGGEHAPYLWLQTPCARSWDFFDRLLAAGAVGTPGAGFGAAGEGWFRLSAFGARRDCLAGAQILSRVLSA